MFEPAPSGFMGFLLLIALEALLALSPAKGWDEQADSSRVGTGSVCNWGLPATLPPPAGYRGTDLSNPPWVSVGGS